MSNPLSDMLSSPEHSMSRARGTLCLLFRQAIVWNRPFKRDNKPISHSGWNQRAAIFFSKPHNKVYKNDMGNLNKDLTNEEFTWPTFKKAVDFLDPIGATLVIKLTWLDDSVSEYQMIIDPAEDESDVDHIEDKDIKTDIFRNKIMDVNSVARLFRMIVRGEDIDEKKWHSLLDDYIRTPLSGFDISKENISELKNNLQRRLTSNKLTWSTFRKGIHALSPKIETYGLELRWSKHPDDYTYVEHQYPNPRFIVDFTPDQPKRGVSYVAKK